MGFTRYHEIDTTHPAFRAGWQNLIADAGRIVGAVRERGISVCGGYGSGPPLISSGRTVLRESPVGDLLFPSGVIWFNGDEALEEDGETFGLSLEMNDQIPSIFTKTEHLPYDLAVSAVLLRAKAIAPAAVRITADAWEEPGDDAWADGAAVLAGVGMEAGSPDD